MGLEANSKQMYSSQERDRLYNSIVSALTSFEMVEGVVRIGSGVTGYRDIYSDIDLMVSTAERETVERLKDYVHQCLEDFGAIYIKAKKHRENVYIIIAILENKLEFNISVLPTSFLSVRSPLWKVIADKTGNVTREMAAEQERFAANDAKYDVPEDLCFEFIFSMWRFQIEVKRNNLIYASKMLEAMRDHLLTMEALDEKVKLHQFKAYETLNQKFIEEFLSSYPAGITADQLLLSADKLRSLFLKTIQKSNNFSVQDDLMKLLQSC